VLPVGLRGRGILPMAEESMSNDLVGRQSATTPGAGTSSGGELAGTPGKRTLVEQASVPAVQMHGGGAQPEAAVHDAAAQGVATPASALPFGDTLQRAFGRHDISSVQAHSGSEAAHTAKSMGADAYAAGDHVVLGKTDLHTVAHEAAHVVQQRSGVQLKGGVGQAGDAYEQHADAVADKVVGGESAEPLLSAMAGAGGTASAVQQHAVQFLGKPLDKPLDATDPAPAHGEVAGKQRKRHARTYDAARRLSTVIFSGGTFTYTVSVTRSASGQDSHRCHSSRNYDIYDFSGAGGCIAGGRKRSGDDRHPGPRARVQRAAPGRPGPV